MTETDQPLQPLQTSINVALTDESTLHCFRITVRTHVGDPVGEIVPIDLWLHTSQAFELFHKLGLVLMEYFARESANLLRIKTRELEQRIEREGKG